MPLLTGDSRLELGGCVHDAVEAYNNVDKWAKTERAPWSLNFSLVGPKIRKEPKGTVLIIRYGDIDSFPYIVQLTPTQQPIQLSCMAVSRPFGEIHHFSIL